MNFFIAHTVSADNFFELDKINNADSNRNAAVKCSYALIIMQKRLNIISEYFLSGAITIERAMAYLIQKDSTVAYRKPWILWYVPILVIF